MFVAETISSFLRYIQFEKRYTQSTLVAYKADLEQFFLFAEGQFQLKTTSEVATYHIRTWMANLKDEGITSRSINRKLSSLKSFYKYHLRQGAISVSPLATLSGPKSGSKLPEWMEPDTIEKLLDSRLYPDDWEGKTAWLSITILYECGLRRSELAGLGEGQVDFHSRFIRVLGKGKKERILPVRPGLLDRIKDYISSKKERVDMPAVGILLVRENGKPIDVSWIYRTVRQYTGMVTTRQKKSPHVLRHSFATHLTNAGAELNAVKELLGHSSLAATQVYTHNSIEKLKNVHEKAHPKG